MSSSAGTPTSVYNKTLPSGRHVVNAGSVKNPKDGDSRACYLVLTADGSRLDVQFSQVEYDFERETQSIEKADAECIP